MRRTPPPPRLRGLVAAALLATAAQLATARQDARPDAPAPDPHARELGGVAAEVLVLDPSDGRLLALTDARTPFADTAPAQSLAQIVTAYAALTDPGFDPRAEFACEAACGDAPSGHGRVALEAALAAGCVRYFRDAAPRVGLERFRRAAFDLGFGPSPSIDYVNGVSVVPAATTRGALPGLMAEGEGLAFTPARAAAMIAIVASGSGRDQAALGAIRRSLAASVSRGEAAAAWREAGGPPAAGKIGAGRGRPNWFVGYAPAERPRAAVVVLADGSGADAARVAARLLARYLGTKGTAAGSGRAPAPGPTEVTWSSIRR